jgi:hypothetical protein
MRKLILYTVIFVLVASAKVLLAQLPRVIVSEYFNANTTPNSTMSEEWTELIVVQDNLDLRGWIVTDNNTAQEVQQGGVQFKDIDFWRNVRAGTIIGIWHRDYPLSSSSNFADKDTNMSDGRIMLSAMDDTYFTRYSNTTSTWLNSAFNVAIDGDILQILDGSKKHVHGLGHKAVPGAYWLQMDKPKANTSESLLNGQTNRFYPGGNSLAEYDGNSGDQITYAGTVNTAQCRTLPNYGVDVSKTNWQFWHQLRRPTWITPTLTAVVNASTVSLTWSRMEDPNPSDSVQGYLVIRDSGSTPFVPVDGRIYTAGEQIGNVVVLQNLSSSLNNYADTVNPSLAGQYTYRVFAYRFNQDDEYGVNTNQVSARGRQYNKVSVASANTITNVEERPIDNVLIVEQNSPNPVSSETTIGITLSNEEIVSISLTDTFGREIFSTTLGQLSAGYHTHSISLKDVAIGTYFYTVRVGNQRITKQCLVIK